MPDNVENYWNDEKAAPDQNQRSKQADFDIFFDTPNGSFFGSALLPRLLVLCVVWILFLAIITT